MPGEHSLSGSTKFPVADSYCLIYLMDDYSDIQCTSCEAIYSYVDVIVEAVCIECRLRASRCQVCTIKLPSRDARAEKRVEGLLTEIRMLRLECLRLQREKKVICVLCNELQKQMVSSISTQYTIYTIYSYILNAHPYQQASSQMATSASPQLYRLPLQQYTLLLSCLTEHSSVQLHHLFLISLAILAGSFPDSFTKLVLYPSDFASILSAANTNNIDIVGGISGLFSPLTSSGVVRHSLNRMRSGNAGLVSSSIQLMLKCKSFVSLSFFCHYLKAFSFGITEIYNEYA